MPKRNSIINKEPVLPPRRSARLLCNFNNPPEPQNPNIRNSTLTKHHNPKSTASNELCRSRGGLRKSPRLNNEVDSSLSLRRSPRFSNKQKAEQVVKMSGNEQLVKKRGNDKSKKTSEDKFSKSKRNDEVGANFCEEIECRRFYVVAGLKAARAEALGSKETEVVKESEEISVKAQGNIKRDEEGKKNGRVKIQGWTKEQEVALQRAYFATKPTPHFWKKVSKLVPGKSAQECFDKIHSDHITPPQLGPRSRADKVNSSPVEKFSLSASKLLTPIQSKIKRSSHNKQKNHLAQKTVRHLLQKNYHMDKNCEADLFSVLEPDIGSFTKVHEQNRLFSNRKYLQEEQEFLQKCGERSSEQKKPVSRFSGSCEMTLVSPPVLKQVKNRALHEKYIDQLHIREAKRKAASVRAERIITGKENRMQIPALEDTVRAAKNALVSNAKNAISQLQKLHSNAMSNSSDFDFDDISCDNEDGESEL